MGGVLNIVSGAPSGALNIMLTIAEDLGRYYESSILLRKYNRAGIQDAVVVKDRFVLDYIWGLCKYLDKHRPDVILVHGYSTHLWTKMAAAIKKIPVIHVEHNVERYTSFRKWLLRMMDQHTSRYICVSRAVAEHLVTLGADKQKIKVIYNGIDLKKFQIEKISHSVFTVGMTARFSSQKDQMTLIRAVEYLYRERHLPIRLILQGSGKTKEKCQAYVEKQDLQKIVSFKTGFFVELAPIIDLFVLSTHYEGFGLVVCEAMAAKIPVIASDVFGVNEIIEHGKNGWLVPKDNYLILAERILVVFSKKDTLNFHNVIEEGYKSIEFKFSLNRMREEYRNIVMKYISVSSIYIK
jgi:glycosyltransferase involved in cell wall biosynthesis